MAEAGLDGNAVLAMARTLQQILLKSQEVTDKVVGIVESLDVRLSGIESEMKPTQIRTQNYRTVHHNIDHTLKAAEALLAEFDVSRQLEAKILEGPQEDLAGYLVAVDELKRNLEFLTCNRGFENDDGELNHARALLSRAMEHLEGEFKAILLQHSKTVKLAHLLTSLPKTNAHSDNDENAPLALPVLIPPQVPPKLHAIAERMVASGHHQQCVGAYKEIRASYLDRSMKKLGVEKLFKNQVEKLQREVLESKIHNWTKLMRAAVKLLFTSEWKLCSQIFKGRDNYRESCFASVSHSSFTLLCNTGEAIAKSKRLPEKLFPLLEMYETMHHLLAEIKIIFGGDPAAPLRDAAISLTEKLAQAVRDTFEVFLDAVEKDAYASKSEVPDGAVHPLTSYVMNYAKYFLDFQPILRLVFEEDVNQDASESLLAAATSKIMVLLQNNLEVKAKQYSDPALAHIFLMNNIHYMVLSVGRSEAKNLLGNSWIPRHRRIVQQHAQAYQRAAWAKVLQQLSGQGLSSSTGGSSSNGSLTGSSSSGIPKGVLKERFKTFNMLLEELHQRQSKWSIPDDELRDAVRLAVGEVLLTAYRNFLHRYSAIVENERNSHRYIKYSPEDLHRLLDELFEGNERRATT